MNTSWKINAELQMLVETNSETHHIVIYTDGSVTRTSLVGGSWPSRAEGLHNEDSGAHRVKIFSLTMGVEVVTRAIRQTDRLTD